MRRILVMAAAAAMLASAAYAQESVCNPICTVDCPPGGGPCRIVPTPTPHVPPMPGCQENCGGGGPPIRPF